MTDETSHWKPTDFEVITQPDGSVSVKRSDGASIPTDPRNRDYQDFLAVEQADEKGQITRTTIPEPEPVKSEVEILKEQVAALQKELSTVKSDVSTLKASAETTKTA